MAHDQIYLRRWAASLRRTSDATRAQAEAYGPKWDYYDLSLMSAEAQYRQALDYEAQADAQDGAPRRNDADPD